MSSLAKSKKADLSSCATAENQKGEKNKKKTAGLVNCAFYTKKINFTKNICEKYSHFTLYML